jgi:hypothetical protein
LVLHVPPCFRVIILVLWAAALAFAAVLPTESGDAFYFAFGGQAGAVNAYGQRLWAVPGELIASDPMGSCLAAAHRVFNGTLFLGTAVTLYTADGRFLWSAVVNINATALATNCVEVGHRRHRWNSSQNKRRQSCREAEVRESRLRAGV